MIDKPAAPSPRRLNRIVVEWDNSNKCRMPVKQAKLLEVPYRGDRMQLCAALSCILKSMIESWSDLRERSNVLMAEKAVILRKKAITQGRELFILICEKNQKKPRAVTEATSLMANFVRTTSVLLESLLDHRRQGSLGGGTNIEASLDVSVSGLYKYSPSMTDFGAEHRTTPFACASEGVSDKAIANVFRTDVSFIEKLEESGLEFLRREMKELDKS